MTENGFWRSFYTGFCFPSPWLFPTRVLVILPLLIIVYRKINICLGAEIQALLNLTRDPVITIPLFFW